MSCQFFDVFAPLVQEAPAERFGVLFFCQSIDIVK